MRTSGRFILSIALISAFVSVTSRRVEAQSLVRARVTQAVDINNRVTLRGNIHPLAQSRFDQGPAPDDLPMQRMLMVLQRGADQETALRQLLDQQQVAASQQFHHWLTPEQFGLQFGPADSDIQAVTDWLTSQGFQVTKVAAGRTVIEFSGSAGLVRQALGAEIHKFHVNGQDRWANVTNPQIPAALAPVIAGIDSLNNFPRQPMIRQLGTFRRTKATGKVEPLLTIPTTCPEGGTGCVYFALGPTDFATIYNVLPLWNNGNDGSGQTIAVVGETNINIQDVVDFRSMFGLPANTPNIILNGPDPGIQSDEDEADLDVQWSGAVAEGATIDFVVSESTETTAGIDLSALYIVDNNLAPVMSESYGACEAALGSGGNTFYSTLWEQASAQGITVLMAAGDSGSAGCDSGNEGEIAAVYGLAVSGFASTPFDVAVGGTDFNFNSTNYSTYWLTNTSPSQASARSYIPEETWNDSCVSGDTGSTTSGCNPPPSSTDLNEGMYIYAGGGGPSNCINPTYIDSYPGFTCSGGYPKPAWQTGNGVPQDGARDIPDVSMFAGGTSFYVICEMDANAAYGGSSTSCDLNSPYVDFQAAGGTSASVQVFAGIMAMVNAAHGRQGNANYVLYPLAVEWDNSCSSDATMATGASASNCVFYDVFTGNNSVICEGGSLNCNNTDAASGEYGAIVTGTGSSQTLAYFTNDGYDLPTGLGSVNVANLVNDWKSNFTTSGTTLILTPPPPATLSSLIHGQPVNFNINVTAGSGTPSGDVSLIAGTGSSPSGATAIGPFTLSGGTASGSTVFLPGGSYNVTAHYAGNGTDGASDSSPGVAVTVSPENSVTQLNFVTQSISTGAYSDSNSVSTPYGYPYILRMDVWSTTSGQSCAPTNTTTGEQLAPTYPCPTGTVTVTPTPTDLNPPAGMTPGTYKLNSQGYAEDQYINLSPGSYSFKASYSGDNSYNSSTSNAAQVTITPGQTTTTLGSLPSSMMTGSYMVQLAATVNTAFSNGAVPTGNVQFQCNGTTISTSQLYGVVQNTTSTEIYYSGQAGITTLLPLGTDNITATYLGDTNYAASASASATITVGDFSLSANPTPITISQPGQTGTSTITITPEDGLTGTVNLSVTSGCPTGATCTLSPALVTLNGTSAVTSTLTVTTTGSSSNVPPAGWRIPPVSFWTVRILGLLVALMGFAMYLSSRRLWRPAMGLLAAALMLAAAWVACGGGGGGGTTTTTTPTAPAVTLSPTSLTFASQTTGTTSSAQNVTLSNSGTAALALSGFTLAGTNSGDFAQTNACGSSVAAGSNCTIAVTFTPTAAGTRTASVYILDNATGSPQAVTLTGTGKVPPTPAGTYTLLIGASYSGSYGHSIYVNVDVQ